ncbi:MAG TPA: SCP2 sterol-binding domain-containing protein [Steroidobacteraceae bacterium]|nr:SCP2 sterol-binding domain-containing protein [Steroidobacteraceae bacterium]
MLTGTLENLLNRGMPRSPRAQELCRELAGRAVAIEVEGFGVWVARSTGCSLNLARRRESASAPGAGDSPADARIRGGPFSILSLGVRKPEDAVRSGSVHVDGDVETAQKFQELVSLLRPDIEEEVALLLGDAPAHQLGRLARTGLGWGRRALATTVLNLAEYLGHERRDLVPRAEGEQFFKGVDALREDADRLAARLDLLAGQLTQNRT